MKTESHVPLVSVVMPVHNCEPYLSEAIDSILGQTLSDLELIIIDDGSDDSSPDTLDHYKQLDDRVVVHRQSNCGVVPTLNLGCSMARGKYVARMDGDDISVSDRLKKQVNFLEANPQVALCSTGLRCFGAQEAVFDPPTRHEDIKSGMIFEVQIAHAAAMWRSELGIGTRFAYDLEYAHAEDYELWVRLADCCRLANIREQLYLYRMHTSQVGHQYRSQQNTVASRIRHMQLTRLLGEVSDEELALHDSLVNGDYLQSLGYLDSVAVWLERIYSANLRKGFYDNHALAECLGSRYYGVSCRLAPLSIAVAKKWLSFSLSAGGLSTKALRFANLIRRSIRTRSVNASIALDIDRKDEL